MRRLCATVLIFEAIVIGLAIPVAITIEHVKHGGIDVFERFGSAEQPPQ